VTYQLLWEVDDLDWQNLGRFATFARPGRKTPIAISRFHRDLPVHPAPISDVNPLGSDVTVNRGPGLDLDPLFRIDAAMNLTSGHDLRGEDITADHRPRGDQELGAGPNCSLNDSLDLHHPFARDIADNGRADRDDGEAGRVAPADGGAGAAMGSKVMLPGR